MIWTLKNALSKNTWIGEKNQCTTAEHIFRATKASQVMEEKKKKPNNSEQKGKSKANKLALSCPEWKAKRNQGNENKVRLKIEKPK